MLKIPPCEKSYYSNSTYKVFFTLCIEGKAILVYNNKRKL